MADTVFLGIDLGTSRTSITSSTGFRKTVYSYVGYPKDYVARKKLGGREKFASDAEYLTALEHQSVVSTLDNLMTFPCVRTLVELVRNWSGG